MSATYTKFVRQMSPLPVLSNSIKKSPSLSEISKTHKQAKPSQAKPSQAKQASIKEERNDGHKGGVQRPGRLYGPVPRWERVQVQRSGHREERPLDLRLRGALQLQPLLLRKDHQHRRSRQVRLQLRSRLLTLAQLYRPSLTSRPPFLSSYLFYCSPLVCSVVIIQYIAWESFRVEEIQQHRGEATINLADYFEVFKPSYVSLPLQGSTSGAILHWPRVCRSCLCCVGVLDEKWSLRRRTRSTSSTKIVYCERREGSVPSIAGCIQGDQADWCHRIGITGACTSTNLRDSLTEAKSDIVVKVMDCGSLKLKNGKGPFCKTRIFMNGILLLYLMSSTILMPEEQYGQMAHHQYRVYLELKKGNSPLMYQIQIMKTCIKAWKETILLLISWTEWHTPIASNSALEEFGWIQCF